MTSPVRPTNARLVRADGEVIPLELTYKGLDEKGTHIWVAASIYRPGDRLLVETLPPHTGIEFQVAGP